MMISQVIDNAQNCSLPTIESTDFIVCKIVFSDNSKIPQLSFKVSGVISVQELIETATIVFCGIYFDKEREKNDLDSSQLTKDLDPAKCLQLTRTVQEAVFEARKVMKFHLAAVSESMPGAYEIVVEATRKFMEQVNDSIYGKPKF